MDSTLTVAMVEEIIRDRDRLRRMLEKIAQRAIDDLGDLPDGKHVPYNYAAGTLLAIQGMVQAALEAS